MEKKRGYKSTGNSSASKSICELRSHSLYKNTTAVIIVFPEFFWSASFFLFEDSVEVGNIIKPAMISHFCNRMGGFDQYAAGMAKSDFSEAVYKSIPRALAEKTTEGNIRHVRQFGNLGK